MGSAEIENAAQFGNIADLEGTFKSGEFNWAEEIRVANIKYTFLKSHSKGIIQLFRQQKDGYIIYQSPDDKKKLQSLKMGAWLVFLFTPTNNSTLAPKGIGFISAAKGKVLYERNEDIIGDVVLLKMFLPAGVAALKGKVDTGAEISSLHVDSKPEIVNDMVKFRNHNMSGNILTAPLVSTQAVKNSSGVENRPVIELDIEMNGKRISKAQFNLNDRSSMDFQVLIGQNVLEKSGFLVDPNAAGSNMESTDLENLQYLNDELLEKVLEGEEIENKPITETDNMACFIIDMMLGNEITFDDLIENKDNMSKLILETMDGNETTFSDLLDYIEE